VLLNNQPLSICDKLQLRFNRLAALFSSHLPLGFMTEAVVVN
jgi:hypothetical protein